MAITRRQFVARLGALAAAAGFGSVDVQRITEAIALGSTQWNSASGKPTVVWIHGAECTGCSTSLLGLFEDVRGKAVEGTSITTLAALDLANGGSGNGASVVTDLRTFNGAGLNVDGGEFGTGAGMDITLGLPESALVANIQDVLVDVIELNYHETIMNMGGDLAAQWLKDFMTNVPPNRPFVLVVEGSVQRTDFRGAWNDASGHVPWCSIGMSHNYSYNAQTQTYTGFELGIDTVVETLARKAAIIIPIGQCATYGGFPGCRPPIDSGAAGFDTSRSQTDAMGVEDFLFSLGGDARDFDTKKVINVPGCPTNPWWFVLTVVAVLVDIENPGALGVLNGLSPNPAALDSTRRLKHAYPASIHSPYCPRFNDWSMGRFARKPGDSGCLQKIGCKGPGVKSLCGLHGWNAQQPHNSGDWEYGLSEVNSIPTNPGAFRGGHCTSAGHPCMGCTEKGYPDSFVPFVKL
ncbi:MAG: twin-arginine translocation signal domain-containing protein [Clostridiales bacterium]|nr:twin-arginine translocation signal domain-containing protein [Clostridiales bacterium]